MRRPSLPSLLTLCLVAFTLAPGCDLFREPLDPPTEFAQRAVLMTQQDLVTLKVGQQKPINLTVTDADGKSIESPDVSWSVEDEGLARIVGDGADVVVEGLKAGQTKVKAQFLDQQVEVVIEVQELDMVATLEVTPSSLGLDLGESVRLAVTVKDEAGSVIEQPSVTFAVDAQSNVVTVDDTGLVTGAKEGAATIVVSSGGVSTNVPVTVTEALQITPSVSVGPEHACAINNQGSVKCWGAARDGRLGLDIASDAELDFQSPGTTIRFASLSTASASTCGLTSLGDVYCWGADPREAPQQEFDKDSGVTKLTTPEPILALTSGQDIHCGIGQTSGKAHCIGQLGSLVYDALSPIFDSFAWTDLSAGRAHVCGVFSNKVYCWGSNDQGQSGQADRSSTVELPQVVRKDDGSELSAKSVFVRGDVSCAIQLNDQTVCWGSNASNHLAADESDLASSHQPVDVARGYAFSALALSSHHVCGLTDDNAVWCWGDNLYGQFGRRPLNRSNQPLKMGGTLKFDSISANASFMCGITSNEKVACWGDQGLNFLGDKTLGYTPVPNAISSNLTSDPIVSVGLGARHSCLITSGADTKVGCWGRGAEGQIGVLDQSSDPLNEAVDLQEMFTLPKPSAESVVLAGQAHTCVFTPGDSRLSCTGDNSLNQLTESPVPLLSTFSPVALGIAPLGAALGPYSTCAYYANTLKCLGDGPGLPDLPIDPPEIQSLSIGSRHGCLIHGVNGDLYCWGDNSLGQLGQGDQEPKENAVLVLSQAIAVSAADDYTCALVMGGGVRCWGRDEFGRLGQSNSSATTIASPVAVTIPGVMTAIATGDQHACALDSSNQVHCWGHGLYGLTGTNSDALVTPPTVVSEVTGSKGIAISNGHSCAWTDDTVKCWGRATQGKTGDTLGYLVNPFVFDP